MRQWYFLLHLVKKKKQWAAIKPLLWNTNWFVNLPLHSLSNSIQCNDCSDVGCFTSEVHIRIFLSCPTALAAGFVQLGAVQCISHEPVWVRRCWHSTNSPDVASSVRQDARWPLTDLTEARGRHNPLHKMLSGILTWDLWRGTSQKQKSQILNRDRLNLLHSSSVCLCWFYAC